MIVPVALEAAVRDATRVALGESVLGVASLRAAIEDRSRRYTSERERLAAPKDKPGDLAARAAFFTIADAMKVVVPLTELARAGALPAARPLRILDLGAGCGAMTLGLVAWLAKQSIAAQVVAIDRDAPALGIAMRAVTTFATSVGVEVRFETRPGDVRGKLTGSFDLVLMGTVLNELTTTEALAVVEQAMHVIGPDGAVIAIEPALRTTTRALHAIRDAALSTGLHVFAPCTRRTAPCPALADPDDWCHEDRPLTLPPRTAELARITGLRDGGMKFAYLVLRKEPRDLVEAGATAWRIVSAPRIAKGKHEIMGCSAAGRMPLRLMTRHRTPDTKPLERADRGDVAVITNATHTPERVEVTKDAAVAIVRIPDTD